jgi:hypothetical protein
MHLITCSLPSKLLAVLIIKMIKTILGSRYCFIN